MLQILGFSHRHLYSHKHSDGLRWGRNLHNCELTVRYSLFLSLYYVCSLYHFRFSFLLLLPSTQSIATTLSLNIKACPLYALSESDSYPPYLNNSNSQKSIRYHTAPPNATCFDHLCHYYRVGKTTASAFIPPATSALIYTSEPIEYRSGTIPWSLAV